MRTPLAWHKVTHNKLRTAASLAGVCIAIILVFMQLGFYDACFRSSTMVLDQFDYDIALVSPVYAALRGQGTIPKERVAQARRVPEVARVAPLYTASGTWQNPVSKFHREILILGVEPSEPAFRLPELNAAAPGLAGPDTAIWDNKAQTGYDIHEPGMIAALQGRRLRIISTYEHGAGFVSPATVIVSDQTMARCFPGFQLDKVAVGLVKLKPGADLLTVQRELQAVLPDDTQVLTRDQHEKRDQRYFMVLKPIGIMFGSGVILALIVGAVILYQVLASEVINHLKEYATLLAMGYGKLFVNGVVLQQAALFAILGYIPAAIISVGLYWVTRLMTNLPMFLTWSRLALVLGLAIAMCSLSGLLANRKVNRADPVELF
jgi:putative ABC transport system permease protein